LLWNLTQRIESNTEEERYDAAHSTGNLTQRIER